MTRGVRLLRPEDRQVRFLVGQDVTHEDISQVGKAAPGKRSGTVEGIGGPPVNEPLNGNRSRRVAVIIGEGQRTSRMRIAAVARKGVKIGRASCRERG